MSSPLDKDASPSGTPGDPTVDHAALRGLRILVIEDEPGIREFVQEGLENAGFVVAAAADGVEGERLALSEGFDAIVLDMMLPGRSGQEVLAAIRESRGNVPVIVLTARGRVADRVAALEAGATDYIVKPFALSELAARLRAQLRRSRRVSETVLSAAGIEADLLARRVRRDGKEVELTSTEFDLLAYLLRHPGRVLTRRQILRSVWGYEHDPTTNNVSVYIKYLRRKLAGTHGPAPIYTVRGVGYRLGHGR